MKDVLANLAKLPEQCHAVIDGQVVVIRRGAREPAAIPFTSKEQVAILNAKNGITDAQQKAMIVGVTLGWDMDGADPDTHVSEDEQPIGDGPFEYRYQAEITVEIVIEARSEQLAAEEAKLRLSEVCTWLEDGDPTDGQVVGYAPSDTLDLVETTDPRP